MSMNTSLQELADSISERLSSLGLHLEGVPAIAGHVLDEDEDFSEDDDDDDDDIEGSVIDQVNDLVDNLKANNAHAIIQMTFGVNKLAWTDRILHPDTWVDPDARAEIKEALPSLQEQVKGLIEEGMDPEAAVMQVLGLSDDEDN